MLGDIKLGIFDHSGVLSNDRRPVYEANMVLLERNGVNRISFEQWLVASRATAGELVLSFVPNVDEKKINEEYRIVYSEITSNGIRPTMYPEAPEALRSLNDKGIKLAIVSSHPRKNLVTELKDYGIERYFDEISGDPSPKGERLRSICDQFTVNPSQAFFVEDTIYGLRSGHAANINCFGVTTGYHSRERLEAEKPYAVIDSLTELLDHLN